MASAQSSNSKKLETPDVALKASADKFNEFWSARPYDMPKASPQKVGKIELVEGQWGKPGAVFRSSYFIEGKTVPVKETITLTESGNYKITNYKQLGGYYAEQYKSTTFSVWVAPASEGSLVCWCVEYEKHKETDPDIPDSMVDWLIDFTKDVDRYLTNES